MLMTDLHNSQIILKIKRIIEMALFKLLLFNIEGLEGA